MIHGVAEELLSVEMLFGVSLNEDDSVVSSFVARVSHCMTPDFRCFGEALLEADHVP
jgi:hypothetical protein